MYHKNGFVFQNYCAGKVEIEKSDKEKETNNRMDVNVYQSHFTTRTVVGR